jgi:3-dehydroquinate synthase
MTTALDPADVAATVRTATAAYPIVVADGALGRLGAICRETGLRGRAFLLTDESVGPLYGPSAAAALGAADYAVVTLAIPAGEEHKHLGTVSAVYDWLIGHRVERQDFVVCLGGGVVTDLGGFAAATCLRGVDFVHVPTSMLAMVDAAVGGKTGVDHPRGKNLIGAFAQPRAVVIDPLVLETLPERQLRAGWAEVVKHGLILDAALFADLEARAGDPHSMRDARLIGRSVAIKAAVVSGDEREAGQRTLLNYGHTFGHAIEAVTGYSAYLHGEAVAIGMRAAGLMAVEAGILARGAFERQQALIRACGLPERAPGLDPRALIEATRVDKKVRDGAVTWVVLEDIGRATTTRALGADTVARAASAITTA